MKGLVEIFPFRKEELQCLRTTCRCKCSWNISRSSLHRRLLSDRCISGHQSTKSHQTEARAGLVPANAFLSTFLPNFCKRDFNNLECYCDIKFNASLVIHFRSCYRGQMSNLLNICMPSSVLFSDKSIFISFFSILVFINIHCGTYYASYKVKLRKVGEGGEGRII